MPNRRQLVSGYAPRVDTLISKEGGWGVPVDLLEDLFNIGNGIRSGIQDVPSFVGNVLTGDVHGAVTDGRKIIGDVGDVLEGVEGLGVSLGKVPERYLGKVGKLSDSPILGAAQLAIEAQKALTGSGAPEEGNGYRESAKRLEECVETLIDAEPHGDRWDGKASDKYASTNKVHRTHTSNVQVADASIGEILSVEAGQVSRTRQTLDETSQYLYDYGLATAWMNFVPGGYLAKLAADSVAAAAAMATTDTTMWILVKNSFENSLRIRDWIGMYENAAGDTSGAGGACGTFVDPEEDQHNNLPSRLQPGAEYTVPGPEEPPEHGPPATPYGSPAQAPPPMTGQSSPVAPASMPTAPSSASSVTSAVRPTGAPVTAAGAQPATNSGGRTPIDMAMGAAPDPTRKTP